MSAEKLDIFAAFRKLNSGDLTFWEKLSTAEKKQASPYVFTMWMTSSKNDGQVLYLNEFVNPYIFTTFKNNPDLAFTMLALSARGKQNSYSWIKRKSNVAKNDAVKAVLKEYFQESEKNIQYYLDRLTVTEFVEICEALGKQDDEIKKLKKEFEKRQ